MATLEMVSPPPDEPEQPAMMQPCSVQQLMPIEKPDELAVVCPYEKHRIAVHAASNRNPPVVAVLLVLHPNDSHSIKIVLPA